MITPKHIGAALPTLFLLASILSGQQQKASEKKSDKSESAAKPAEFTGEAKVNDQRYKFEKGALYRITVKANGFVPELRVLGLRASEPPVISPLPPNMPNVPLPKTAQVIFAPRESREYVIKVDFLPRTDIGKGPHTYVLTIERAAFKSHTDLKDPQLNVSHTESKFEKGKAYHIAVTGRGFEPDVQIMDGNKSKMTAFNSGRALGFGQDAEYVTDLTFVPVRTADYRILVAVGPYSKPRTTAMAYTTKISELKVELNVNEQLASQDPQHARGGPYKVHTVKLEASKKYQIDMISSVIDPYLFLQDSAGNPLLEDDDGGGNLNARIIYQPAKTDTYRIVATIHSQRPGIAGGTGPYQLLVTENPYAQPRVAPKLK